MLRGCWARPTAMHAKMSLGHILSSIALKKISFGPKAPRLLVAPPPKQKWWLPESDNARSSGSAWLMGSAGAACGTAQGAVRGFLLPLLPRIGGKRVSAARQGE